MEIRQRAGRAELVLEAKRIGNDYSLALTGGSEHVGAVAVGNFDEKSGRATASVITLPGHREESIAIEGARRISQATRTSTVLTVGIHLDNISVDEISQVVSVSGQMIDRFIASLERD